MAEEAIQRVEMSGAERHASRVVSLVLGLGEYRKLRTGLGRGPWNTLS